LKTVIARCRDCRGADDFVPSVIVGIDDFQVRRRLPFGLCARQIRRMKPMKFPCWKCSSGARQGFGTAGRGASRDEPLFCMRFSGWGSIFP